LICIRVKSAVVAFTIAKGDMHICKHGFPCIKQV
jgi:hypothetical protein